MNNRYIDPQKIHYFKLANGEQVATKESIDKIPAADVQKVRHGTWKIELSYFVCPCCGFAPGSTRPYRYCPMCGLKMDEKEQEK